MLNYFPGAGAAACGADAVDWHRCAGQRAVAAGRAAARGSFKPLPRWGLFLLQVLAASALMAVFLLWAASSFDWTGLQARALSVWG